MVTLREYRHDDVPSLVEYLNNPSVTRYLSSRIQQPYTEEHAHWWVSEGSRSGIVKVIECDGCFAGTVGASPGLFERARTAEVGYWLGEPWWGRGVATAALNQLTTHIFETTDIVRLAAYVFAGNTASMRVLEKCGYRQEAVLAKAAYKHGAHIDNFLYVAINPAAA